MSQLFTSGGQSISFKCFKVLPIGQSISLKCFKVLPMTIQEWYPLRLTVLISLTSKGLSRVFSNITVQKHKFFNTQLSLWSKSHIHTSVQFSSVAQSCLTLCNPVDCSTPGFPAHHQLPELSQLMSIESVMPSNHLILCRPPFLPPSIFPRIRVFSYESVLHIRWPKYWSFSFSISPFDKYSGLISFRMDWLDLLAVQGTLKSLLQHYSSKASIL